MLFVCIRKQAKLHSLHTLMHLPSLFAHAIIPELHSNIPILLIILHY